MGLGDVENVGQRGCNAAGLRTGCNNNIGILLQERAGPTSVQEVKSLNRQERQSFFGRKTHRYLFSSFKVRVIFIGNNSQRRNMAV